MRRNRYNLVETLGVLIGILACWDRPALAADTAQEFPYVLPYELGDREFAPGDKIMIEELRGTSQTITTGQTYCVTGSYTLASKDKADLSFFATTKNPNPTPIDSKQTVRIKKGSGSFRLIKRMDEDGYLHVSFYAGSSFGGVYFGQGEWVLRDKHFSLLEDSSHSKEARSPDRQPGLGNGLNLTGPNQVLFEYLGNPVEPPAKLNPAYSKEGLTKTIESAAQTAAISLRRLEIDDSEFPFLVGVVCGSGQADKLKAQIRTLTEYTFAGGVGGDTSYAMNIVPYPAFPPHAGQRIYRRMLLREAVLLDKINAQP
jgi:hypothetical protein